MQKRHQKMNKGEDKKTHTERHPPPLARLTTTELCQDCAQSRAPKNTKKAPETQSQFKNDQQEDEEEEAGEGREIKQKNNKRKNKGTENEGQKKAGTENN